MLLGVFDLVTGILLLMGETVLPGSVQFLFGVFMVFKGITTLVQFPIWFGPLSFLAGFVDLAVGLALYFTHDFGASIGQAATVMGVMQTMKGAMTLAFAYVAG